MSQPGLYARFENMIPIINDEESGDLFDVSRRVNNVNNGDWRYARLYKKPSFFDENKNLKYCVLANKIELDCGKDNTLSRIKYLSTGKTDYHINKSISCEEIYCHSEANVFVVKT
jgi:hypothetical protein